MANVQVPPNSGNVQDVNGNSPLYNSDGSFSNAPVDGKKATYSATATGLATLGSAGILATLTGSASKKLRLTRIEISGLATSATTLEFVLNKYSTAATGGTAGTAPTVVPLDSSDAAAAGAVAVYTAAPTAGTLVGAVRAAKINLGTSAAAGQFIAWDFGNRPGEKAILLNGAAQQLGLTTSATASGSSVDVNFIWTEE